ARAELAAREGGARQGSPDRRRDQGRAGQGAPLLREADGARYPGQGDARPGHPLRAAARDHARGGRLGARADRRGARLIGAAAASGHGLASPASDHLRNHTPETLAAARPDLDLAPGLANRIVTRLVAQDRDDLEGVRGLSRETARALLARTRTSRLEVLDRRRSAVDPFVKYLFRSGGATFET